MRSLIFGMGTSEIMIIFLVFLVMMVVTPILVVLLARITGRDEDKQESSRKRRR